MLAGQWKISKDSIKCIQKCIIDKDIMQNGQLKLRFLIEAEKKADTTNEEFLILEKLQIVGIK